MKEDIVQSIMYILMNCWVEVKQYTCVTVRQGFQYANLSSICNAPWCASGEKLTSGENLAKGELPSKLLSSQILLLW